MIRLVGTPEQIRWADDIRQQLKAIRPLTEAEQFQPRSWWWIDHRFELLQPKIEAPPPITTRVRLPEVAGEFDTPCDDCGRLVFLQAPATSGVTYICRHCQQANNRERLNELRYDGLS